MITDHSDDKGLFELWHDLEIASGRKFGDVLNELNKACGTAYKHNWPSQQRARGYELSRCPVLVRQYMMRVVLSHELKLLGIDPGKINLDLLIKRLT